MDYGPNLRKFIAFLKCSMKLPVLFWVPNIRLPIHFPNVARVRLVLKEEMESGDTFMRNIATRMFAKFKKYWSEFSTIMAIAAILDPCYKYQFIEWTYKKVYSDNSAIELRLFKDKFFALYAKYAKSSKGSSPSPNPSSNIA